MARRILLVLVLLLVGLFLEIFCPCLPRTVSAWNGPPLVFLLAMGGCGVGPIPCFAQQTAKTYRLPFHTVNSLILLNGKINGRPGVFLLDTGAGPNYATYEAIGSKPQVGVTDARIEVTLGELRITCPARIVGGLQSPKTDGTLGEDFLRRLSDVRIDYKNHLVFLATGSPSRTPVT